MNNGEFVKKTGGVLPGKSMRKIGLLARKVVLAGLSEGGISRTYMCKRFGIDNATFGRWLKGIGNMDADTVIGICDLLYSRGLVGRGDMHTINKLDIK